MTIRIKLTAAIALALAALATLALLLGGAPSSNAQEPAAGTPGDPESPFAVFRRDGQSGDEMPTETRAQFESLADQEGIDLDAARAVASSGTRYVYAIPGPDKVCLGIPDPIDGYGVTCQDAAGALAGRLWVGLTGLPGQQAGDVRAAVLVPDGVETVTAVDTSEAERGLTVSDNVAFADLEDSASVEYEDGEGTHSVDVPGTPEQFVVEGS